MTRSQAASALAFLTTHRLPLPVPDGAAVLQGDRRHAIARFSGPFASVSEPPDVEIPEVVDPTTGSILHVFSDMHMQCPPEWYGGYKDARIERAGYGETALSDLRTGDPVSSTFTFRLSDYDLLLRRALASTTDRYWTVDPVPVHMTTRANRALLGRAYLVYLGVIIDAQPARPLSFEFTLGDYITQRVITDRAVHPWRKIGDGFIHDVNPNALGTRSALSTVLDYNTPEPTIYGEHRRIRGVDEPSEHGFEVDVTDHYLGIWEIDGGDKHVWLVAGHACADIPDVNTVEEDNTHTTVIPDEGTVWWIPHYAGWTAIFGAPYVDIHSTSFGNLRRYTLILGAVGTPADIVAWTSGGYPMDPAPDAPVRLMVFVDGVDTNGDGTGDCLLELTDCYLDWVNNYGARSGADGYQSGARLTAPTWVPPFEDAPASMVDEDSFATVKAINQIRFPALNGYRCAAIIGAKAGDIHPATKWMSDFNRSGFCCSGWHQGQYRIATPHPTLAAKAAARSITDAYEMRQGSFETVVQWGKQANRLPFLADPDYPTGEYKTSSIVDAGDAISNYGREIMGDVLELPFAPGIAMATHVAFLHNWLFKHPPRHVIFQDTIGPDANDDSLGYLKVGEYVDYQHYAQVGEPGVSRVAWVLRKHIDAGARRVLVEAWDMEEFIDFDIPAEPEATSPANDTCETAIDITVGADEAYAIELDTTDHATDAGVAAISGLPGPAVGYHAAWFAYTPPANGTLFLTTVHSQYDTQLAVNTGACGALTNIEYNDNDGILTTSILEFAVTSGVPLKIVVYGYGPDDGGPMTFGLLFTAA